MRTKQRPLFLTLGGLVVGIGLGLLVSLVFISPTDSKLATTPLAEVSPLSPKNDVDNENIASVPTDIVAILELDTASARRLALYELIENKTELQIADLLIHSFSISPTTHLSSVQILLFAALARLDPELSYDFVWETERANLGEHLTVVFEEWAGVAPRKAMEWAARLQEPWKSKAIRTILQTRQDFSEDQLFELAESFGTQAHLNALTFETQIEEVIDKPKAAFELVLNADIPESRRSEFVTLIIERWIEREDAEDVSSMLSLVHEVFSQEQHQWRLVVSNLAATDPKLVWEKLSTLSLDAQKMLNDEVFRAWVKKDAMEAIVALNDSEYMTEENWELGPLYAIWASAVWHQLPDLVDLVPVDYRTRMLTAALRDLVPRIEPTELLEQLEQIQLKGVNTKGTLESYFTLLSNQDPALAVQLASEYLEEGSWVFSSMLQELALEDVNKAMEIALQQPLNSYAEHSVIQALFSQGWLLQGLELLPKVREGTDATNLYVSAGELLIDYERASQAIALAEKLSDEARSDYFLNLAQRWSYKDINDFLPVLNEIPEEELRSRVAEQLLRVDRFHGNLTDEEIGVVRSFLQAPTE